MVERYLNSEKVRSWYSEAIFEKLKNTPHRIKFNGMHINNK